MITSAQYSVGATAVKIASINNGYRDVYAHVTSNGAIYVGPAGVTITTGLYIDKNSGIPVFHLPPEDELWAIAASGTETITTAIVGP